MLKFAPISLITIITVLYFYFQNSHPAPEKFQELLEQNPHVFYPTRTAKSLMNHWQLLKQYQLLPDQTVQPLPKGNIVIIIFFFLEIVNTVSMHLNFLLFSLWKAKGCCLWYLLVRYMSLLHPHNVYQEWLQVVLAFKWYLYRSSNLKNALSHLDDLYHQRMQPTNHACNQCIDSFCGYTMFVHLVVLKI